MRYRKYVFSLYTMNKICESRTNDLCVFEALGWWVFVLDRRVFVLDQWVFVLDRWVFVLDQWVFGLRSSLLGLRFRYIPFRLEI